MLRFFNRFIQTVDYRSVIKTIGCARRYVRARRGTEGGSVELTYRYFVLGSTELNRFPVDR